MTYPATEYGPAAGATERDLLGVAQGYLDNGNIEAAELAYEDSQVAGFWDRIAEQSPGPTTYDWALTETDADRAAAAAWGEYQADLADAGDDR
jgi:hypothetical protein